MVFIVFHETGFHGTGFHRIGCQRNGYPLIFIHGDPSMNIINGYPSMNINGYPSMIWSSPFGPHGPLPLGPYKHVEFELVNVSREMIEAQIHNIVF